MTIMQMCIKGHNERHKSCKTCPLWKTGIRYKGNVTRLCNIYNGVRDEEKIPDIVKNRMRKWADE